MGVYNRKMFQNSEKGTSKFYNFEKKTEAKFYSRVQKKGGALYRGAYLLTWKMGTT